MRFAAKPNKLRSRRDQVGMLKFADRLTVLKAVEEDLRVRLLQLRSDVSAYADTYVPGPPCGTYRLRVPAACVAYVPEAQGSGCVPTRRACRTYVPRTVVPQVSATDVLTELHLTEKVAKKLVEKFPEDAHLKPQVAK